MFFPLPSAVNGWFCNISKYISKNGTSYSLMISESRNLLAIFHVLEASHPSLLISIHLLRDQRKGQTVSVETIIQTDCWSPPPFTSTINFIPTFLMVADSIHGERERERKGVGWGGVLIL